MISRRRHGEGAGGTCRGSNRIAAVTGVAGMIDEVGHALTAITPDSTGRISAHGENWSATAAEPITEGDRVQVVAVNGLTLTVRRAAQILHAGDDEWTSHR